MTSATQQREVATFAGGCFWGVEHIFLKHYPPSQNKGILKTAVGYTGGKDSSTNPSYRAVCDGTTNHAEAVRIEFDPSIVTYDELVEFFFRTHDPTTLNRQGADTGTQYRSAIFTHSTEQANTARRITEEVQAKHFTPKGKRVVTEIVEAGPWYEGEEYHQLYLFKNPHGRDADITCEVVECTPQRNASPSLYNVTRRWCRTGDVNANPSRAAQRSAPSFLVIGVLDCGRIKGLETLKNFFMKCARGNALPVHPCFHTDMPAAYKVPEDHPVHSFFTKCDPQVEIYVTHFDSANASIRKQHFLMLLGMNMAWSFLLTRRVYRGMFRYGVWFALGKLASEWGAPAPRLDTSLLGNVFLDLFIFIVLIPIIRDFITGVAVLRLRYGFPQHEVIFRKPSESTIASIVSEVPDKRDAFLKDLLRRAVEPEVMKHATFGLPWEEWAYDYRAMAAARELDIKGVIDAKMWETCVWMKMKDSWTAVEQGKEADIQTQVSMMEKLRDRLRAMDKIHVFHQMMEVIQAKTMSKDGAPLPVTEDVDTIIADIFKRNGIDFEEMTSKLARDASVPARFVTGSKKHD